MCWMTGYEKNTVRKISDGNVKCRKVCFLAGDGSAASWYQGFRYETGKTYGTEIGDALCIGLDYSISEGFHSYSHASVIRIRERGEAAMQVCVDITECGGGITDSLCTSLATTPVILECHIPEGSAYCENEWGELVSEAITVDSITIMDGNE